MTVPATARRAGPFNGNGVTTSFPFTFKVFTDEDILVVLADADGLETTLTLDSDYSVAVNADQDASPGGTITYPLSGDPLAVGETLTTVGALEYTQELDLPSGGNFSPRAIENALDRTTFQIQQLAEELGRSLTLPVSAASADTQLPVPEAGAVIGWNATADGLRNIDPATLATVVAYANWRTETFDGGATSYVLAVDPGNASNCDVSVGGVSQTAGVDFTVSGTTLTPTTPWPAGTDNVSVRYGQALPAGAGTGSTVVQRETIVATEGQTDFTLTSITYLMGVQALIVIAGGFLVESGSVTELTSSSFRLASGVAAGTKVEAIAARVVTEGIELPQIAGASGVADHLTGGATDQASYLFRRRAAYSGGTPGFVNACLWADTFVESSFGSGASTASSFEWSIVGVMRNYSNAGENVGIYGQGLKYSTGPTWGMVAEAIDWTGTADPTTGLVGLEVDSRANGTDANSGRIGIDVVASRPLTAGVPSGAVMVTSYGVRLQNGGDADASFGTGFAVGSSGAGTARAAVGFDTSAATISQAAYKMAEGQPIAFNAGATRKLYHDGSGLRFADASNTIIGRITDGGAYQGAGGVQLLGARDTGYAAMTGTANKAAVYDTATVTTAQLAARVMALQAALTAHGIIGA